MNISCHVNYVCSLSRSEYEVARASQYSPRLWQGTRYYPDFEVRGQQRHKGLEKRSMLW